MELVYTLLLFSWSLIGNFSRACCMHVYYAYRLHVHVPFALLAVRLGLNLVGAWLLLCLPTRLWIAGPLVRTTASSFLGWLFTLYALLVARLACAWLWLVVGNGLGWFPMLTEVWTAALVAVGVGPVSYVFTFDVVSVNRRSRVIRCRSVCLCCSSAWLCSALVATLASLRWIWARALSTLLCLRFLIWRWGVCWVFGPYVFRGLCLRWEFFR